MTEGPRGILIFLVTLWFLREHRCISGVQLDVSMVARFHPLLFMKHLVISKRVVTVHLKGLDGLEVPFQVCPLLLALDDTERLTHVILDQVTLTNADSVYLSSLVTTNKYLESLALRNVTLTVSVLAKLVRRMQEYQRPRHFELRGKFHDSIRHTDLVSRLAATPLHTLRLEVFGNLTQLFQRLKDNERLHELELGRWSTAVASLDTLASALAANTTLRRLILSLDMTWLSATSSAWNHLGSVIKNSRTLEFVRFRKSSLGSSAVIELSEAIEQNKTLSTLDLECCGFSFTDALAFTQALCQNLTLNKVRLGDLTGDEDEQHRLFQELLANDLCKRVSCVFTHGQAEAVLTALQRGTAFRELRLRCPRARRIESLFDGLMNITSWLRTLSLSDLGFINRTAALSLSWFLGRSTVLRNVEIGAITGAGACLLILQGLSQSTSIRSLKVDRWCLEEATAKGFERFLKINSSVIKMTIIQKEENLNPVLAECLQRGLKENYSVSRLRLQSLQGKVDAHDFRLWRSVQINRMIASRAGDFLERKKLTASAMFAFNRIMSCDARNDIICQNAGFKKNMLDVKLADAIRTIEDESFSIACLCKEMPQGGQPSTRRSQFQNLNSTICAEIRRCLDRMSFQLRT
ncbi:hypothetical protein V5799_033405 [Amblyomma americanum]|uniref:Ran gtpase-activating protein n=1 Tax=Amblyomma americanum TaxID=6943 RepID=A0AAQ4DND6_AMBAM